MDICLLSEIIHYLNLRDYSSPVEIRLFGLSEEKFTDHHAIPDIRKQPLYIVWGLTANFPFFSKQQNKQHQ